MDTLEKREGLLSLSLVLLPEVFPGNSGQALGLLGGVCKVSIEQANSDLMPENQSTYDQLHLPLMQPNASMSKDSRWTRGQEDLAGFLAVFACRALSLSAHNTVQVVM